MNGTWEARTAEPGQVYCAPEDAGPRLRVDVSVSAWESMGRAFLGGSLSLSDFMDWAAERDEHDRMAREKVRRRVLDNKPDDRLVRIYRLVAESGRHGLTRHEVSTLTRWDGGPVSGYLTTLHDAGLLVRLADKR